MRKSLLSVLVGGLLLAGSASADTIEATFNNVNPYTSLTVTLNGADKGVKAGVMNWTRTGGTYDQTYFPLGGFKTFCVELTQYVNNTDKVFTVESLNNVPQPGSGANYPGMGDTAAEYIEILWGNYYSNNFTSTQAAAFQVAIWEIVYDTGFSLSGGSFKLKNSASVNTQATTYLNFLSGLDLNTYDGPKTILQGLSNAKNQDQAFYVYVKPSGGDIPVVPAPATVWSGGLLLAALVGLQLRRNAKQA